MPMPDDSSSSPAMAGLRGGRVVDVQVMAATFRFTESEVSAKGSRSEFSNVVIRVETEEGAVGWGEASGSTTGAPAEAVLECARLLAPRVRGLSVVDTATLRRRVMVESRLSNVNRLGNLACAGYDIAFWDAAGHLLGVPITHFLGGRLRTEIDTFAYSMQVDTDSVIADLQQAVAGGRSVVYLKAGYDDRRDLATANAVREAFGGSVRIRFDANEGWNVPQARRMLAELEPLGIDFVEAPIDGRNVSAMAALRRLTSIPIAANEGVWSLAEAGQMVEAGACDVIVVGPLWLGGLRQLQHLIGYCNSRDIGFCLHSPPSSSIAMGAALSVLAAADRIEDGNQSYHPRHVKDDLSDDLRPGTGGTLLVPEGPGIGIDVQEDRLQAAVDRYRLGHGS